MTTISASNFIYIRDSGGVQYSLDNSNWITLSLWPVNIVNTNPSTTLYVFFTTDITLTSDNQSFLSTTDNIQYGSSSLNADGTMPTITVSNVVNYYGLIGDSLYDSRGWHDNITICNLRIVSDNSTLFDYSGWIAWDYFGTGATNNRIINCYNEGNIPFNGGGIAGSFIGNNGGEVIIRGCHNSGEIGQVAGGICGEGAAIQNSNVIIDKCINSGNTSNDSGGIVARGSCKTASILTITNCYNTGASISTSGGIIAQNCGDDSSTLTIENCYSTGTISFSSAGICVDPEKIIITNCYSTGTINDITSGGIIIIAGEPSVTPIINNCYTSGASATPNTCGIVAGSSNDNLYGTNNYSEANNGSAGWKDINALSALTGAPSGGPIGTSWITLAPDVPYNIRNIGFSPYSIDDITIAYELNPSYSQTISAGDSTIAAILPLGYTYSIVGINNDFPTAYSAISINVATGQISTTPLIAPGVYEIIVRNEINPYNVTIFYLTILGGGEPTIVAIPVPIPPCCEIKECIRDSPTTDKSNEVLTTTLTGKTIIGNVDRYYSAISNGTRTFFAEPVFKSYREYMIYLQTKQ